MRAPTFWIVLSLAVLLGWTCSRVTEPSTPPANVAGAWTGIVGQSMSGTALRITWVATQTGGSVAGTATLIKPGANVPAAGVLAGTVSGSQLSLTYLVARGSVPGFADCVISGSGSATATSSSIT